VTAAAIPLAADDVSIPVRRSRAEREAIVLDTAERLFATRSSRSVGMDELVRETGLGKMTVYRLFKSKDDLLISWFEMRMTQVNAALRAAIDQAPPPEQLHAFIRTYLQLVQDEPGAAEVLTIELRQSSKFMKEYENPQFVDFLRMLGGLIAAGQERGELDPASLESLLTPYRDGLMTLIAPLQPTAKDTIPPELVGRVLDMLKQRFDYIVVDTAPAFDDHVLKAFDHTDLLLLLLTLDVPAVKAAKIALETLDLINYPRDRVRLILNRADSKVGLGGFEVEKALGAKVMASIPSAREVPASINRGEPITTAHPRHPVTQALEELARLCVAKVSTPNATADSTAPAEAGGHRSRSRFARKARA